MKKYLNEIISLSIHTYLILIYCITILFPNILVGQSDWERWGKVEIDYSIVIEGVKDDSINTALSSILSTLKSGYSFFISDLDGDNCPFYPTCSAFFVKAVTHTNILQGTLMFADRFTRDSNLFKSHNHYPLHISGRLYDPVYNYKLIDSTIIFYSTNKIIK